MLGYNLTNHTCIIDVLNSGKDRPSNSLEDPEVCLGGPEFSSGFTWELNLGNSAPSTSSNPNDFYVRVLYEGRPLITHCPKEKLVQKYFCPYDSFKKFHIKKFQFSSEADQRKVCVEGDEGFIRNMRWDLLAIFLFIGVILVIRYAVILSKFEVDDEQKPILESTKLN